MSKSKLSFLFVFIVAIPLVAIPLQSQAAPKAKHKATQQQEKDRLVLMPLRVPEEDKNLTGAMETALVEGLQQKYDVFSGEQVSQKAHQIFMKESRNVAHKECDETRCMQNIAEAFQAELIATANVTKQDGSYFLALSIQNIFDNKVVYSNSLSCDSCKAVQVVDMLKKLSGTILATAALTPTVEEAKKKSDVSSVIPVRPVLPFELAEDDWNAIEKSDAYLNLPMQKVIKVNYENKFKQYLRNNEITNEVESRAITPLGEKCKIAKVRGEGENVTEGIDYSCGKVMLGITDFDGTLLSFAKNIKLSGSIFPLKVGAEQVIQFSRVNLGADTINIVISCKVTSRVDAHQLSSKLSGIAWTLRCEQTSTTGSFFSKESTSSTYEDYFLEDLGVFLSHIGVMDIDKNKFVLPTSNSKLVGTLKHGDIYLETRTFKRYEWKVSK